ncbi:MAG TPA: GerMN domain-containing protein [Candidatus Acidoferrum sp.]|nr:GerMN domain-containing protein [Candidatus Acidoferrum sp.]
MSAKWRTRIIVGLVLAVLAAAIYFPILRRRVKLQALVQQKSEEQARRELVQSLNLSTNEPKVKAKLFWASDSDDAELAPNTVELPLSNDPALRAKQVLNTLLAGPVDAELRTLPADAVLLAFYILPDGTAVADFSEAMATSIPSGVQSEQLAIDSITKTIEANVPQVRRLKILIHGQEVETLAGHLDLTGTFPVSVKLAPAGAPATTQALPSPATSTPATQPPASAPPPAKK